MYYKSILSHISSIKCQEDFLETLEVTIRKDKVIEVVISEGWYSEAEMAQDLKWTAWGPYRLAIVLSNFGWFLSVRILHVRARIAGAKRVCEANPDALVRPALNFSQIG